MLSRVVAHTHILSSDCLNNNNEAQKTLAEDDHIFEASLGCLERNSLRKQTKLPKSPKLNHRRQSLTTVLGDTVSIKL